MQPCYSIIDGGCMHLKRGLEKAALNRALLRIMCSRDLCKNDGIWLFGCSADSAGLQLVHI